jgi:L-rhamnose isomerase / sugar isomerase
MKLPQHSIDQQNEKHFPEHQRQFLFLSETLENKGIDAEQIVEQLIKYQITIPSWALGTGGTRFGRFPGGGEPRTLEEKIDDVGLIHALNGSADSISLHIPLDIPQDAEAVKQRLQEHQLIIDSVNSNTFQDQKDQAESYKFGSLCHTSEAVRQQAIDHNIECIEYGKQLGADILTVWLADGSNFPGQHHFRQAYQRTADSLSAIYKGMPSDWRMLIEYKPYEPNFYSMVIPDWGTSYSLCQAVGENAHVLVDLGHHLPNTNIEQIVARLMHFGRLGGFHFNGSMYGDDDLTTASTKPFQLYLIFQELVSGLQDQQVKNPPIAWMIDASHNTKDPLEDLLQSCQNILATYAKALITDRAALAQAQEANDVLVAEETLRDAFFTDVRPLVAEAARRTGGALDPIAVYRAEEVRKQLITERGKFALATGL